MEFLTWLAAAALGSLAGLITGLIPGLHVNTLAAVVLALATAPLDPFWAIALVAIGITHTFVSILPATYLGAPGEDTALAVLPAHRLLRRGLGREAVFVSARASLFALVVAVPLLLPLKWLLLEPGRGLPVLEALTPYVILLVLGALLWQEHGSGHRRLWAFMVLLLSGALGFLALDAPVRSLLHVPASPLLPLLGGLFGAAGLVAAMWRPAAVPPQLPPDPETALGPRRGVKRAAWLGVAASSWTAFLPGLTAATATAMVPVRDPDHDGRPIVAALSAVNTAHTVLALGALWIVGRSRSGLAVAAGSGLEAATWGDAGVPDALLWVLATVVAAGLAGYAGTRLLDAPVSQWVHRVRPRLLSAAALLLVSVMVVLLSGGYGVLIYVAATVVGLVPLAVGVRRVHLAGCLLLPILWRITGG